MHIFHKLKSWLIFLLWTDSIQAKPQALSSVFCWGGGVGSPMKLPLPTNDTQVVEVSTGRTQKAAVTKNGRLFNWEVSTCRHLYGCAMKLSTVNKGNQPHSIKYIHPGHFKVWPTKIKKKSVLATKNSGLVVREQIETLAVCFALLIVMAYYYTFRCLMLNIIISPKILFVVTCCRHGLIDSWFLGQQHIPRVYTEVSGGSVSGGYSTCSLWRLVCCLPHRSRDFNDLW